MADTRIANPRVGRPPMKVKAGTRVSLGLKVTAEMKERIDKAARESGRTQSQEAEARLERTFQTEGLLPEVLQIAYGRQAAGLLLLLAGVVSWTGRLAGFMAEGEVKGAAGWLSNPFAFAQVESATDFVLSALRPVGDTTGPKALANVGPHNAASALLELIGDRPAADPVLNERIRELLGDTVKMIASGDRLEALRTAAGSLGKS